MSELDDYITERTANDPAFATAYRQACETELRDRIALTLLDQGSHTSWTDARRTSTAVLNLLREPANLLHLLAAPCGHLYWSTSCLHAITDHQDELHQHCRSAVNIHGGTKKPGTCKHCPGVCLCTCHGEKADG